MPRKKHSAEEIIQHLRTVELTVKAISYSAGISIAASMLHGN